MGLLLLKDLKIIMSQKSVYVLIAMILVLFSINGIFYSYRYNEQISYYSRLQSRNAFTNPISRYISMPPNPLQFCSDNNPEQLTISYYSSLSTLLIMRDDEESINKFVDSITWLDWTNLVKVIFSLLVIVMAHNLISDELKKKTLSLMCSYPIPRWKIYLSKLLSVMIVTMVIVLMAMTVGLLSIIAMGSIPIDSMLIAKLMTFFVISMTYCSLFCVISIVMSVFTRHSAISLTSMIFLWIVFTIILPESITFAVNKKYQSNFGFDYSSKYMYVDDEYTDEIQRIKEYADQIGIVPESKRERMIQAVKERLKTASAKSSEGHYRITTSIIREDLAYIKTLNRWLLLSPSTLYQVLVEKMLKSGDEYLVSFVEDVLQFNLSFREDMYNKYNTYITFASPVDTDIDGKKIEISVDIPEFEDNGMQFIYDNNVTISSLLLWQYSLLVLSIITVLFYGFFGFVRLDVR